MLLLVGLRGVMSLMFKEDTIDETQIQKQQMTMGMGQMGQDPQKAFEQERAALDAVSCLALDSTHLLGCIAKQSHCFVAAVHVHERQTSQMQLSSVHTSTLLSQSARS